MRSTLIPALLLAAGAVLASPVAQEQIPFSSPASPIVALALDAPAFASLSSEHRVQLQQHIESLPELVRVRLTDGTELSITEGDKPLLSLQGLHYIDITNEETFLTTQVNVPFPKKLSYSAKQLQHLFDSIDTTRMKVFLTKFSSYRNRYYRAATGAESQQWLLAHLKELAVGSESNVTLTEFKHPWGQNSIIVRFNNPALDESTPVVILGAHLDSTNLLPFLPAPGAGDDGSGVTTLIEAFIALTGANFVPSTNPVEFQFVSAEEGGLLGSQAIAQDYTRRGVAVRGMMEMDMTAWVKKGTKEVMGVIQDFVDPALTAFIVKVINEYSEIGAVETKCGYRCSDFASWNSVGVPAAFVIESAFADSNQNIHSTSDRIDISPEFSFEHMAQFSRLSIGMVVELGGGDSLF